MEITKTIELKHWREFTKLRRKLSTGDYIFRGHSNSFNLSTRTTNEWKIHPAFKRYLDDTSISFEWFIHYYLNDRLFKMHFSTNKFPQAKNLIRASLIEKLYFFQHYGIPTCLIDFTKDPLYALFFAISGIKIPIVRKIVDNRPATFPENHYFTIIQLHVKNLIENYGVKTILDPDINLTYDQYSLNCLGFNEVKIGLDLDPIQKIKTFKNKNLIRQKGCFLLFDNSTVDNCYNFERVIDDMTAINQIHLNEPVITKYRIPYNSIFRDKDISLFTFLDNRWATGRFLFNDIQGIKYDILHYLT